MALDTRTRPQHPPMQFMPQGPVVPQFTNPWVSQEQMNDAATNLQCLAKPTSMRTSGVSASYGGGNLTALTNNMRSLPPSSQYTATSGLMANVTSAGPAYTSAEMSMPGSTAPSPTTSGATYVPSYSSSLDISVPPRSNPDRRLSQPTMPASLCLGADVVPKQRQASLTDMAYRPRPEPLDFGATLDSTRGMMVMSQAHPRSRQDSNGSVFPSNHSTSSSISSTHSFPYYNGGSVDSSATDYSDTTSYPNEQSTLRPPPTLPRPSSYVGSSGSGAATVPNQMMTTFSSKITSSTQKKHKCKVCDKRFTRPSSLQTHTYSHTGEKPFVCEQQGCGRRFSVVSNLRRHKKVHQGKPQNE